MDYLTRRICMICGTSDFSPVVNLGNQCVVDFVQDPQAPVLRAPLELIRCEKCNLVQLKHSVAPDRLYRKFWYRSGINESMRQALKDVAVNAYNSVKPQDPEPKVLDIGCNDGTLLGFYPRRFVKVGIDPCKELVDLGSKEQRIDIAINGYFSKKAVHPHGPFKLITSVAMFYDVDEPQQFLEDCRDVLDQDGVLIIQMNYLLTMLQDMAFDNVCHEHLAYYSMMVFKELIERAGLECQGAEVNSVNGGSLRVYITHPGKTLSGFGMEKQVGIHADMHGLMIEEHSVGLHTDIPYQIFGKRVENICSALRTYIMANSDVLVYGASTRGSTLMQCLNLPEGKIKLAAERDSKKWGLYTVGTNIHIQDEEYCRTVAKHFLVLPWHFMDTLKRREDRWLADGGKFIVPLPAPFILSYEDQEIKTPLAVVA